ncbi:hypothetical protein Tco_1303848 [Tanacetum coccineum]
MGLSEIGYISSRAVQEAFQLFLDVRSWDFGFYPHLMLKRRLRSPLHEKFCGYKLGSILDIRKFPSVGSLIAFEEKYVPSGFVLVRRINFGEVGYLYMQEKSRLLKRRKSLSPNGVKVGEAVETIGS